MATASASISTATLTLSSPQPATLRRNPLRIYGLIDPRDGVVRYVGETTHALDVRLENHLADARTGKKPMRVVRELAALLAAGLTPTIVSLPYRTEQEAIDAYHAGQLWNETRAGAGRRPSTSWSDEELALLGQIYDYELGDLKGVSRETIRRQRKLLCIPACRRA